MGDLFKRNWPLRTPPNSSDKVEPEKWNFLYSKTKVGCEKVNNVFSLMTGTNTSIIINMGLSGIGKTFLAYQLAVQRSAVVFYYDCSVSGLKFLPNYLKETIEKHPKKNVEDYEKLSEKLYLIFLNFSISHLFGFN